MLSFSEAILEILKSNQHVVNAEATLEAIIRDPGRSLPFH